MSFENNFSYSFFRERQKITMPSRRWIDCDWKVRNTFSYVESVYGKTFQIIWMNSILKEKILLTFVRSSEMFVCVS